jgi:hypothetical protein
MRAPVIKKSDLEDARKLRELRKVINKLLANTIDLWECPQCGVIDGGECVTSDKDNVTRHGSLTCGCEVKHIYNWQDLIKAVK